MRFEALRTLIKQRIKRSLKQDGGRTQRVATAPYLLQPLNHHTQPIKRFLVV